ncbi:hypothetical protein M7I_7775 [Glarea lozoyensis 74030]|uniref:Uncharacterized protein n=1 Tax=Glarea lozoyensis (strain ATCC 74030 / MF5533) TaxID=1104152 RepID=H0EY77_GLAL7|nr:hypothetical protein M7I_7775 [Glarea lozoyensis 74030]
MQFSKTFLGMSLLFASMAAAAPVVVRAAGDATADFQPEELRQSNDALFSTTEDEFQPEELRQSNDALFSTKEDEFQPEELRQSNDGRS